METRAQGDVTIAILSDIHHSGPAERARGEVEITFREYARAGVPLTLLSLAAGVWMLN